MLDYLARTLPVALRARIRQDGRRVSRIRRRVSLRQIDLNFHMNQACYAQEMELSRTDWVMRSGAWQHWTGRDIKPVVAEQRLVYRRELKPRARFELDTRAVGIEGKLLRFETHLLVGDRVHALGQAALIFVGPDGVLREPELRALCAGFLSEPLAVEDWRVVGA